MQRFNFHIKCQGKEGLYHDISLSIKEPVLCTLKDKNIEICKCPFMWLIVIVKYNGITIFLIMNSGQIAVIWWSFQFSVFQLIISDTL